MVRIHQMYNYFIYLVSGLVSGTISVYTFSFLLNMPNTIFLPQAPLPLLPFTLLAPK